MSLVESAAASHAPLYLFGAVWWQARIGNIATAFVVKNVRSY